MASITSIHLPRSRSAVLQRTFARFSVDGKLLKGLTVGQAVLEIPLSEGSKLELPVYFPVHSRICPRMYIHVYCRVYLYVYIILAVHCIYNVHAEGFAL